MKKDPCQGIIDEIARVEDSLHQLAADSDADPKAAEFVKKQAHHRLRQLEDALKHCHDKPPTGGPFSAVFSGTATVHTDISYLKKEYSAAFQFPIVFSDDYRTVVVSGISLSFSKGDILVAQSGGGVGMFSFSGLMSIPITLDLSGPLSIEATIDLPPPGFTTEQAAAAGKFSSHGIRLDQTTGAMTLAAAGTAMGSILDGSHAEAILAGTLMPVPVAIVRSLPQGTRFVTRLPSS